MSVNASISEYLRMNGISQSELARKLKTNQPNLNRILKSEDMKLSLFLDICKELELSPAYFLGFEEVKSDNSNDEELERLKDENKLLKDQLKLIEQNLKLKVELRHKTKMAIIDNWMSASLKEDALDVLRKKAEEEREKEMAMTGDLNKVIEQTFEIDQNLMLRHLNIQKKEIFFPDTKEEHEKRMNFRLDFTKGPGQKNRTGKKIGLEDRGKIDWGEYF